MPRVLVGLLALLLVPTALAQPQTGNAQADEAMRLLEVINGLGDASATTAATGAPAAAAPLQAALTQAAQQVPRPSPLLRSAIRAAHQRPVARLGRSGVSVTLPIGWDGPALESEGNLSHAVYVLQNTRPGHPLAGALIRVERVVGFEGVERERWLRGQTPYRYHGAGPIGPAQIPGYGYGVELGGGTVGGAVTFVPDGRTMWAVGVEAPAALWASHRDALLATISGVRLP